MHWMRPQGCDAVGLQERQQHRRLEPVEMNVKEWEKEEKEKNENRFLHNIKWFTENQNVRFMWKERKNKYFCFFFVNWKKNCQSNSSEKKRKTYSLFCCSSISNLKRRVKITPQNNHISTHHRVHILRKIQQQIQINAKSQSIYRAE